MYKHERPKLNWTSTQHKKVYRAYESAIAALSTTFILIPFQNIATGSNLSKEIYIGPNIFIRFEACIPTKFVLLYCILF